MANTFLTFSIKEKDAGEALVAKAAEISGAKAREELTMGDDVAPTVIEALYARIDAAHRGVRDASVVEFEGKPYRRESKETLNWR